MFYDTNLSPEEIEELKKKNNQVSLDNNVDIQTFINNILPKELSPYTPHPYSAPPVPTNKYPNLTDETFGQPKVSDIIKSIPSFKEVKAQQNKEQTENFVKDTSEKQDLLKDPEMAEALQSKFGNQLTAALGRAGTQIGHAIAGVKPQADYFADVEKMAGAPEELIKTTRKSAYDKFTQGLELKEASELKDPDSQLSKQFRETTVEMLRIGGLNSMADKIPKNASAAVIQKMFPQYTNLVNAKMAQDNKLEQAKALGESRSEAKETKQQFKNQDFLERQVNHLAKSDEYTNYTTMKTSLDKVKAILSKGKLNSVDDIALLYTYISTLDPKSTVREGEVALAKEGKSVWDNISIAQSKFGNNPKVLTDDFIKNIHKFMEMSEKVYKDQVNRRVNVSKQLAKSRGIKSEDMYPLDIMKVQDDFPKQITKGNQVTTVENEEELKEAMSEGWR